MIYSYRVEQAIRAATILHDGQTRRGAIPYPYITHLFAVALIVADYTDDEDTIIAALLHDTLEDTDYTPQELERDFGVRVKDIVLQISEPRVAEEKRRETWGERKEWYLSALHNAPLESLVVGAADKIHNMRSMIEGYAVEKEQFLEAFHGTLMERFVFHQKMSNILNKRLTNGIIHEFNHVFDEFKTFIESTGGKE